MKKKFFLIAISLVLISAIFVGCDGPLGKNENTSTNTLEQSSEIPPYTLPQNDGSSTENGNTTTDSTSDGANSANTGSSISSSVNYGQPDNGQPAQSGSTESYKTGNYIVNTVTDPLSLRLKPSAADDNVTIRSIPKGAKVEVIAVKDDWGYVVYADTGGWVSMKYLKPAA
ncbi:MAG: hypothetical protein GX848_01810 [Clostridiales bacterium]|jgi:hypothetical protein|nr:hypothetical protein [Clostridiales bacterium]